MDKQQDPTAEHGKLYPISTINQNGKEYEIECVYNCVALLYNRN